MRAKRTKRRPPEGARKAAWSILRDWEAGGEALEAIRENMFAASGSARREKALVTELTQGVVRHRLYLEHNIRSRLDRPDASLPSSVWLALLLGAYQLLYLDRIPAHAAVKETVQMVKDSRYRGFAALINAVLRKMADMGACPVPDPDKDPLKHLQLTTSSPGWLVERLVDQNGLQTARKLLESLNHIPPLTLRTNTLFSRREDLIEELRSTGIEASPGQLSDTAVTLHDRISPRELQPLVEGRCVVQDEGAQMIAPLLSASPGHKILDMCSAPGGKTGHLAQIVRNGAFLVAVDKSHRRVRMMVDGLGKAGFSGVRYMVADLAPESSPLLTGVFDRILLDAPCSGTGVLKRHPEGKWKKDLNTVHDLVSRQWALLETADNLLRPGGWLLYTTCSILREENEDLLDRYTSDTQGLRRLDLRNVHPRLPADIFSPRGDLRLWPHIHGCDGFFACLMERSARS